MTLLKLMRLTIAQIKLPIIVKIKVSIIPRTKLIIIVKIKGLTKLRVLISKKKEANCLKKVNLKHQLAKLVKILQMVNSPFLLMKIHKITETIKILM